MLPHPQIRADGSTTHLLEDPSGANVAFVSAVEEHSEPNGRQRLFLGNIVQDYVSYIDLT